MRKVALAIGFLMASNPIAADTVNDTMFACESFMSYSEAQVMKTRGDTRGLDHMIRSKRCFKVSVGTEYSVIGVNPDQDPSSWVRLRIYDGDSSFEVYSWLGFTY
jgi:hypothetical protein